MGLKEKLSEGVIRLAFEMASRATKIEMPQCKFCGSYAVVRNGRRRGTQYWLCKNCGRGFVANKALPKMKYPTGIVADAVYDFYAGTSLNKISKGIEDKAQVKPSTSSIYGWIQKLTNAGLEEAKKYQPQVGSKWVMDETVIRLGGKKYWYIIAIDADTRFILGTKVSHNRNKKDIQFVLEKATAKTGKIPAIVLSDGWGGYRDAIELAYGSESKHIVSTPFESKELSTNLIERWNGTLKDRLKPMRGMDRNKNVQLVLDGFTFYYNFLRPHQSLGMTPAKAAKIKFPYKSWQDIIKSQLPPMPTSTNAVTTYETTPSGTVMTGIHWKPYRKRSKPKKRHSNIQTMSSIMTTRRLE